MEGVPSPSVDIGNIPEETTHMLSHNFLGKIRTSSDCLHFLTHFDWLFILWRAIPNSVHVGHSDLRIRRFQSPKLRRGNSASDFGSLLHRNNGLSPNQ